MASMARGLRGQVGAAMLLSVKLRSRVDILVGAGRVKSRRPRDASSDQIVSGRPDRPAGARPVAR
jgi:hypothetical protein